jgi:hypothetical protein
MSNKNFKSISSGTPGAFNTGFVAKAGVVGSESAVSVKSPFTVIDVNVNVGALGTVFPLSLSLGTAIPPGSIITQASINGRQSVFPGTTAEYEVGLSASSNGAIVKTITGVPATTAAAPPGDVGTTVNGSQMASSTDLVAIGFTTSASPYPVLTVSEDSDTVGNINVKIVYFSS